MKSLNSLTNTKEDKEHADNSFAGLQRRGLRFSQPDSPHQDTAKVRSQGTELLSK